MAPPRAGRWPSDPETRAEEGILNPEEAFCRQCGAKISATAKFCESCGAEQPGATGAADPAPEEAETSALPRTGEEQAEPPTETRSPRPPQTQPTEEPALPKAPAGPRTSGASDFAQAFQTSGQLPGLQLAIFGGLIGAAVVLAAGFIAAVALPDSSFIDVSGSGSDVVKEALTQAASMSLATLQLDIGGTEVALREAPLLFALFPFGGCALGAYLLSSRTRQMSGEARILWGAAMGIFFAIGMLVISIAAGKTASGSGSFSPSEGSVFLLSLMWGALGGLTGATLGIKPDEETIRLSTPAFKARGVGGAALRPLGAAFLAAALIGTTVWVVQTVRDASDARGERTMSTALADDVLYSGDYGLRYIGLGTGTQFKLFNSDLLRAAFSANSGGGGASNASTSDFLPIPVSRSKIPDLTGSHGVSILNAKFRMFDYGDVLPAWAFAPLLIALMVIPAFLALYAGFAVARAAEATSALLGAAWGAVVGVVWATVLILLNALSQDLAFGQMSGDDLLVATLLGGAVLGALGGLVAGQQRRGTTQSA